MLTGWREASAKDRSEVVKNLVSALAIVIAGIWVLYQWSTLFPKTEAELLSAASDIRTEVSGSISVQVGDGGASSADFDEEGAQTCSQNSSAFRILETLVSGSAVLKSASNIPIKASFREIKIFRAEYDLFRTKTSSKSESGAKPIEFVSLGSVDRKVLFGGLSENRIEKEQQIKTSFIFSISIPFACNSDYQIISFQGIFDLIPVDPRTGKELLEKKTQKVLISSCQINSTGYGGCNIDNMEAYGQ